MRTTAELRRMVKAIESLEGRTLSSLIRDMFLDRAVRHLALGVERELLTSDELTVAFSDMPTGTDEWTVRYETIAGLLETIAKRDRAYAERLLLSDKMATPTTSHGRIKEQIAPLVAS